METSTCPNCGWEMLAYSIYCPSCQERVSGEDQPVSTAPKTYRLRDVVSVGNLLFGCLLFFSFYGQSFGAQILFALSVLFFTPVLRQAALKQLGSADAPLNLRLLAGVLVTFAGLAFMGSTGSGSAPRPAASDSATSQDAPKATPSAAPDPFSEVAGKKPEVSAWDGSLSAVKDWVKDNTPDAQKVEFKKWFGLVPAKCKDGLPCWGVRVELRSQDRFGSIENQSLYFHLRNGEVIEVTE